MAKRSCAGCVDETDSSANSGRLDACCNWIGPPYIAARKAALRPVIPIARRLVSLTELDARALLVHCVQEMNHLATFLPALYEQES